MSVDSKRTIDDVSDILSTHDDKKQHTKPGRKPIETEPKSKRTAQNRAAQRAYRERKEKKMKDLEDQVLLLEDHKIKADAKEGLLKAQIEMLKSELSRYRGHSDFSDLNLPKVETPGDPAKKAESEVSASFPWSTTWSSASELQSNPSNNHLPDLTSGSSTSNSPLNENVISPSSNSSDNFSVSGDSKNFVNLFEEERDPFCASLSEACGTRSKPIPKFKRESQQYPPPEKSHVYSEKSHVYSKESSSSDSPFQSLFTPNLNIPDPLFNSTGETSFNFALDGAHLDDSSMPLLTDSNFDVSLALGNFPDNSVDNNTEEKDPLAGLVNEKSVYDQFDPVNTDFTFNEFVKSSYPGSESSSSNSVADSKRPASSVTSFDSPTIKEEDDKDEVVPAPQQTLKCSEIWDRITAHPRYSEIDIDGLCSELKSKAKCSEKGVVLDADDVSSILQRKGMSSVSY